jgi:uncharacterized membrane protein
MLTGSLRETSATAVLAAVATAAEYIAAPEPARIVLGVLLVFLLPGFAAVCATLPRKQLSAGERVLASLGASLAITVCSSILLGATIGLSQKSIAGFLGFLTIAACIYVWLRHYRERYGGKRIP